MKKILFALLLLFSSIAWGQQEPVSLNGEDAPDVEMPDPTAAYSLDNQLPPEPLKAHYGHEGKVLLNDQKVTPGVIVTISLEKLCTTKWGLDKRHVTDKMKAQVYKAYSVEPWKGICAQGCEVDHLVSRELGGADDVMNLWPQPYSHPGAHEKDQLENYLHKKVCNKELDLIPVQQQISVNWWWMYLQMMKEKGKKAK